MFFALFCQSADLAGSFGLAANWDSCGTEERQLCKYFLHWFFLSLLLSFVLTDLSNRSYNNTRRIVSCAAASSKRLTLD